MTITENTCPACKESNDLEAVVCAHCGAVLEDPFLDPGLQTKTTNFSVLKPQDSQEWTVNESEAPEQGIAIYIDSELKPAFVESRAEFVMGRRPEATADISADLLDLSPLGGYSHGLSRKHASLRRTEHGYEIRDLGSANGTWLNDTRLLPNQYYPLPSKSHLRLGSMRLYVLYRPVGETKP